MKKITLYLGLGLVLLTGSVRSQGLQNIIVEKYYVSNAADAAGSIGTLPVGSVTYRIYVDMKAGYKFQAAYGTQDFNKKPLHVLKITTTTTFFNNEDRGDVVPDKITVTNTKKNSVMIDTWVSVGATAVAESGIPKASDTDGSVGNSNGILQNNDASAGLPIKTEDGMAAVTPQGVTTVGIDSALASVFAAVSQAGNSFYTTNGSWASLNGSVGADTTNKVLIAQITTDGVLYFELNIQLGTPGGGTENYVANNATGNEIMFGGLTFTSAGMSTTDIASSGPSFNVYPNPIKDRITLEINSSKQGSANRYVIYDVQGNVIVQKELGTSLERYVENVDLSSLPSGLYVVTLTSGEVTTHKKIIKN